MSTRLHLPHPHIADHVAEVFEHAFHAWPHRPAVAHTDPVAIARWAEWQTPDQWLAEHGRTENPNA